MRFFGRRIDTSSAALEPIAEFLDGWESKRPRDMTDAELAAAERLESNRNRKAEIDVYLATKELQRRMLVEIDAAIEDINGAARADEAARIFYVAMLNAQRHTAYRIYRASRPEGFVDGQTE